MNFKEIKNQGFSFGKIDIDKELLDEIYNLSYDSGDIEDPKLAKHSGESVIDIDSELSTCLKSDILSICEDEETFEGVLRMGFMAAKFNPGDFIKLHRDTQDHFIENSFFHLNMWLPRDNFEGRDFLYGKSKNLKKLKPSLGECVLISDIGTDFWHGVTLMKSGKPFVCINGFQILPETNIKNLEMGCEYYGKNG